MTETKKLYHSISEVSTRLGVKPHVLRYWETQFRWLRPKKNRAGNRSYQEKDLLLLDQIRELLYDRRFTIEGARKELERRRKEPGPGDAGDREARTDGADAGLDVSVGVTPGAATSVGGTSHAATPGGATTNAATPGGRTSDAATPHAATPDAATREAARGAAAVAATGARTPGSPQVGSTVGRVTGTQNGGTATDAGHPVAPATGGKTPSPSGGTPSAPSDRPGDSVAAEVQSRCLREVRMELLALKDWLENRP